MDEKILFWNRCGQHHSEMCVSVLKDGTILEKWEIKTNIEHEGPSILPDIADTIQAKLQEKALRNQVEGIGIGLRGPVEEKMEKSHVLKICTGGRKNVNRVRPADGNDSKGRK